MGNAVLTAGCPHHGWAALLLYILLLSWGPAPTACAQQAHGAQQPIGTTKETIEVVLTRTRFVISAKGLDKLAHADGMLIVHYRNGDVITHRIIKPSTLAHLGASSDRPLATRARKLLLAPNREQDRGHLVRRDLNQGQRLYARPWTNRTGFRTVIVFDGKTVHYLDMKMPRQRFMKMLSSFTALVAGK